MKKGSPFTDRHKTEIEKFLDTPVKHYSSGMYVRLAFAVAAHLEPEIMIVDEVLAVGDVKFQEKCLEWGPISFPDLSIELLGSKCLVPVEF
jgi:ABC-type glutathione transport system ATPase component